MNDERLLADHLLEFFQRELSILVGVELHMIISIGSSSLSPPLPLPLSLSPSLPVSLSPSPSHTVSEAKSTKFLTNVKSSSGKSSLYCAPKIRCSSSGCTNPSSFTSNKEKQTIKGEKERRRREGGEKEERRRREEEKKKEKEKWKEIKMS